MKKMKGVAAATTVMEYSPYAVYEDQRTRLKHQSLMQDFEDLHRETDATRKKLQMMKERKMTLLAEVRFLRRRHKFLMQNQSSNTPVERNLVQASNMVIRSKSNMNEKKTIGKEHTLRHLATGFDLNQRGKSVDLKRRGKSFDLKRRGKSFDLNQKGKTYSEKETTFAHPSLMFDLNQRQKKIFNMEEEVTLRSSLPILDLNQRERLYSRKETTARSMFGLNQRERVYSGKEATARSMAPIFDLNQISREEEEMQANDSPFRIEELKKSSIRIGSEEDIKISACRNTGNGPSRVGKRKISWQDPVVVRV